MVSAEASDALVEIKPGEIGMVSGIPEEHLRRKVTLSIHYPRVFCLRNASRLNRCGRLGGCFGLKMGDAGTGSMYWLSLEFEWIEMGNRFLCSLMDWFEVRPKECMEDWGFPCGVDSVQFLSTWTFCDRNLLFYAYASRSICDEKGQVRVSKVNIFRA